MQIRKNGFVLLFVMMVISLLSFLSMALINYGMMSKETSRSAYRQKQAQYLALSGVSLAVGMFTQEKKEQKDKDQKKQSTDASPAYNALFALNTWYEYALKQKDDGIDGTIRFYPACENGKINLNTLYDFEKKEYSPTGKKLVTLLDEKLKKQKINFKELFDKATKDRKQPLSDVSELLGDAQASADKAKVEKFLWIPLDDGDKKSGSEGKKQEKIFALSDLFTVEQSAVKVEPVFISSSLGDVLGFGKEKKEGEKAPSKDEIYKLVSGSSIDWKTVWSKAVAPWAGKQYTDLSQSITELFSTELGTVTFSVTSIGIYEGVQQAVVAHLGYKEVQQKDKKLRWFYIKKLYWL